MKAPTAPYVPAPHAILLDATPADIRRAERWAVEFIKGHLDDANLYEASSTYELPGRDLKKALAFAFLVGGRRAAKS